MDKPFNGRFEVLGPGQIGNFDRCTVGTCFREGKEGVGARNRGANLISRGEQRPGDGKAHASIAADHESSKLGHRGMPLAVSGVTAFLERERACGDLRPRWRP